MMVVYIMYIYILAILEWETHIGFHGNIMGDSQSKTHWT